MKKESGVRSQESEWRAWLVVLCFAGPSLLACHAADGPRIRGVDLAAVSSAFAAVDPGLDLGPAPSIGIARVFRVAELVRVARQAGLPLDSPPADVCFE